MNVERALSVAPLKLMDNRVWRTYAGGRMIERWQGLAEADAIDSDFPEIWVASTVTARNVGREHIVEGLSYVDAGYADTGNIQSGRVHTGHLHTGHLHTGDAQTELADTAAAITLKELIESDPVSYLGQRHVDTFGSQTAVLVKILDAAERLTIQVHPDREFAERVFQSRFGKTEAWYVLGGRSQEGEEPCVWLGFKPGATRQRWSELFEQQDIAGMIDALHRIPIRKGDVFLVEGGVPHAIGKGCFLIEIQEPTDLTLRVERTTPRGHTVPDQACHQGVGFERMLDSFHYEALRIEETLERWKKSPRLYRETSGGSEHILIGREDTDRFRMHTIRVEDRYPCEAGDGFCIVIVVSGGGRLTWSDGGEREWQMDVKASDLLFMPAAVSHWAWERERSGDEPLHLVVCYPPQ